MNRHVLTVNLRDDPAAIRTYVDRHMQVWPEVLDSLRRAGVRTMDIYLLGRRLAMVVELEEGLDLERVFETHRAGEARVMEWERLMASLQEGSGWTAMEPVFHFD